VQHCKVDIDYFIHMTHIISQSCTHTQSLGYDWAIQKVNRHFVQDLGARTQQGVDREDYKHGNGENDTIWITKLWR
jgi:hypothetical protein